MKNNYIYTGDCIETMNTSINPGSIDLIYADPPYNLSGKPLNLINNTTGGAFYKMNEDWDTWDYDEYINFSELWLTQCFNALKESGSLYISCTYHNVGELAFIGKKLGLSLKNILTWHKSNSMPSITKRVFTHSTEFVCWFTKGKNWTYNYNELKSLNPEKTKDGECKQMRDFINIVETPIVQGKERLKSQNGRASHPTQKPEKLLEIIIKASSNKGELVLDPFFGTGTTGVVAEQLNRRWIGIEVNQEYVHLAKKRIKELSCQKQLQLS